MRWLSIIGIGEDGLEGLTPHARAALQEAAFVFGGQRHIALANAAITGSVRFWPNSIETALGEIAGLWGQRVAVLASGDPFHFGIGSLLAEHVPAVEMNVFPKPSSLSLAAARLGWALQDCKIVSLHGRPLEDILPLVQHGARILALAWDGSTAGKVAEALIRHGHDAARVHALQALDGPHEAIISLAASDWGGRQTDPLTVLAVEIPARGGTIWPGTPGLDDARFAHDGQLTKQDIRAATLARLQPQSGQVLWDIGGGSGSIGIEWMLRHPANRAIAIERQPERIERIKANAAALGVVRLETVMGAAPEALHGLPQPDAIFIGGGTSNPAIIAAAIAALKPGGRLVANAVTVEGEQALLAAAQRLGGAVHRTSIDKLDSVGPYRAWRASMTVIQWVFVKGAA